MLDDMFDYLESIRERPVWQPIPDIVRNSVHEELPREPSSLESVHRKFMNDILPYAVGNTHPGFMGWVHGGGTAVGMLAEMLAAGLNANLGGRDQMPIEIERQIVTWVRDLFHFPQGATGLFVTGTSMANLVGILVARSSAGGTAVRRGGLHAIGRQLTAYASVDSHLSIARAMEISGIGSGMLRLIPPGDRQAMDLSALEAAIQKDREAGHQPFLVVGTAGSVDTGTIDELPALADIAGSQRLWFHVDGAYGALAMLAPNLAPRLSGIERADSIAFDFHKWGQVPYDAGFLLVRDGLLHRAAFASPVSYLAREGIAMAAGSPWPSDLGADLSRGFRALKTWFTIKVYGIEKLGEVISRTCELARYMAERITASEALELLAPVSLNIVCFGYRCDDPDRVNLAVASAIQRSGTAAPSTAVVGGRTAIRAAIVNHRTDHRDVDALLDAAVMYGAAEAALERKSS